MAFSKLFERRLDNLFKQRTHWLRQELGRKRAGAPPKFSREKVNKGIKQLQQIASDALASKLARVEFDDHAKETKNYRIKGRGRKEQKLRFEAWFKKKFPKRKSIVYSFWNGKRDCIYVGRTGPNGTRPSGHFEKYWFAPVKRVKVYSIAGSSHAPKLECLAIHHFRPRQNINKAATKKWTKACPLCTTHQYIQSELRQLFRLK